jgi:hypothetical protein
MDMERVYGNEMGIDVELPREEGVNTIKFCFNSLISLHVQVSILETRGTCA